MTPEALRRVATAPAGEPVPSNAEVVIVGGGVIGLSIAYNLALRGLTDVLVLERGYLAEGASGRNGGGVRQQWATESHIRLMQRSVALCRGFAKELGVNVWFRQGGYLFLARTAGEIARLEKSATIQQRCGLPTRMLSPREAAAVVPELDTDGILGACFNPLDGILFPWPFLWGYAQRATELGARVFTHTPVTRIDVERDTFLVHTSRGTTTARRVVNACGAWSPAIARMVGVELPTRPIRHEICSTEPLKPFLGPMVSELSSGLYCSQSMRGEIVGGVTVPGEEPQNHVRLGSTLAFLETYARHLVRLMPVLGDIKVLRQWAGPYDLSPDGNPILGAPEEVPGFFLACGFVGHGFMMAPVIGELYGIYLAGGARHEIFDRWRLERFGGKSGLGLVQDMRGAHPLDVEDLNIG